MPTITDNIKPIKVSGGQASGSGYKGKWTRDLRGAQILARRGGAPGGGSGDRTGGPVGNETAENTFARFAGRGIADAIEKGGDAYQKAKAQAIQDAVHQQAADKLEKTQQEFLATLSPAERKQVLAHRLFGATLPHQAASSKAFDPSALDAETKAALDALSPEARNQALLHKAGLLPATHTAAGGKSPMEKQMADLNSVMQMHQHAMTAAQNAGDLDAFNAHQKSLQELGTLYTKLVGQHAYDLGQQPGGTPVTIPGFTPPAPAPQTSGPPLAPAGMGPPPTAPSAPAGGQPGAMQSTPQPQRPMVTPEQRTEMIRQAAAARGILPEKIGQFPALSVMEHAKLKEAVGRQFSDPMRQRQEYYNLAVQNGRDPTKSALVPDEQTVPPELQGQQGPPTPPPDAPATQPSAPQNAAPQTQPAAVKTVVPSPQPGAVIPFMSPSDPDRLHEDD